MLHRMFEFLCLALTKVTATTNMSATHATPQNRLAEFETLSVAGRPYHPEILGPAFLTELRAALAEPA